jgi:hypothetical protein
MKLWRERYRNLRGGFVAGTKIDAVKDSPPVRGVTSATFAFGTILNLGAMSVLGVSRHGVGPGNNAFDPFRQLSPRDLLQRKLTFDVALLVFDTWCRRLSLNG